MWVYEKAGDRTMSASQLALPVDVQDDGEIRLYKMALPFLPPSKNVYDGWPREWKSGVKKKWVRAICQKAEEMAMPQHVLQIGLAATLVFPSKSRRDPQNYSNCLWNFVPDALQKANVIDDDREGMIEIGPNWGLKFEYDTRVTLPKKRRERTLLAITMLVPR